MLKHSLDGANGERQVKTSKKEEKTNRLSTPKAEVEVRCREHAEICPRRERRESLKDLGEGWLRAAWRTYKDCSAAGNTTGVGDHE